MNNTVVHDQPIMQVVGLQKSYGDARVLADVTFDVQPGEFVCVVGPSGSGKTTLLRTIAGLQPSSAGEVIFEGERVTEPPQKMAVVFQDYSRSLLPWMSVHDNVVLPMRNKFGAAEREAKAAEALKAVGLEGKEKLYPWEMSGGMQQRAAIARGLAYEPDVLLMDEPFAAVDAQTRIELEDLVLRVRDQFDQTVLFVTHDIDEAVYLADRVIVLSGAPTTVTEDLRIDLPRPRHIVDTKALPRYAELRNHVLTLIQDAKSHSSLRR
ncbi:MAG: ABC transporter ATP-binding protein [Propionibacteriaceae bacterium]|nr:ABC transporter ATP-binding protein [Propionibacteriaceae bacterium]